MEGKQGYRWILQGNVTEDEFVGEASEKLVRDGNLIQWKVSRISKESREKA